MYNIYICVCYMYYIYICVCVCVTFTIHIYIYIYIYICVCVCRYASRYVGNSFHRCLKPKNDQTYLSPNVLVIWLNQK